MAEQIIFLPKEKKNSMDEFPKLDPFKALPVLDLYMYAFEEHKCALEYKRQMGQVKFYSCFPVPGSISTRLAWMRVRRQGEIKRQSLVQRGST